MEAMDSVDVGDGLNMPPWDPTILPYGYRQPGWYLVTGPGKGPGTSEHRKLFWAGRKDGWMTDPGPLGMWCMVLPGDAITPVDP